MSHRLHKDRIRGMSLLEVVLAIAVAGFVLTAAVSLLVSISSIWSERSERHFFTDHVDGVTEFLNAAFANSGSAVKSEDPDNGNRRNTDEDTEPFDDEDQPDGAEEQPDDRFGASPGGSLVQSSDEPVRWERPPGFDNYQEPLLNFTMTHAPPILVSPENEPTLDINTFLHFEAGEGLSLLWYSILQEEVDDINDLRRTLISPLVNKITYIYWDERFESWEEEDNLQKDNGVDQYIMPRFIKLFFEYEGETKERILTIPVPSKSALIF
jgi:hypothetical protein